MVKRVYLGIEPETSRTAGDNHTPTPKSQDFKICSTERGSVSLHLQLAFLFARSTLLACTIGKQYMLEKKTWSLKGHHLGGIDTK